MLSRDDVIKGIGHGLAEVLPSQGQNVCFGATVIDSRQASEGDLFVALKGERDDGHNHIASAIRRGATGVIAERMPDGLNAAGATVFVVRNALAALQSLAKHWRLKHRVEVIGITGSVGKTTTKDLIAALLGRKYRILKNEGNFNNEIGLPLSILKLNESHERAVIEMGMYSIGEIKLLCDIAQPRIGVVTNVGHSHFGRLESLEAIASAKGELVQSLPADGIAVLNGDDERVAAFARLTAAKVVLYGLKPTYDIWAGNIKSIGLDGVSFVLHHSADSFPVEIPLPGRHNVHNALAAAAVALAEGFSLSEIANGLKEAGNRVRLVARAGLKKTILIDDTYNASPSSMAAALNLLAELDGRKIAVLGDMFELGSFETEGHCRVGRHAADVAQILVAVGERGRILGKEAAKKGLPRVIFTRTNEEAAEALLPLLHPGDYVLVKGSRAMAMEQIVERLQA